MLTQIDSGDSYTQTNFNVNGTQPSAVNPMGNPTLGKYDPNTLNLVDFHRKC